MSIRFQNSGLKKIRILCFCKKTIEIWNKWLNSPDGKVPEFESDEHSI